MFVDDNIYSLLQRSQQNISAHKVDCSFLQTTYYENVVCYPTIVFLKMYAEFYNDRSGLKKLSYFFTFFLFFTFFTLFTFLLFLLFLLFYIRLYCSL